MKLFLHWLGYDLRRFRLMLGVWTLLVAAYAGFLGWIHDDILTVGWRVLDWSKPMAIALGLLELGFLLTLFNSDPADGPRHFWKTRPPSGLAIAGVKLVIALGFFLLLPLLAWAIMNAVCVVPGHFLTKSPAGLSWTAFLFWAQSLTISAFALAAARAENGTALYLRLLVPVGTAVFCVLGIQETWNLFFRSAPAPSQWERWLRNGFFSLPMAVLALTGAAFLLLRTRRARLPSGWAKTPLVLLPAASLLVAAAIYRKPAIHAPDESLPPAPAAVAGQIQVSEPLYPALGFQERNFVQPLENPRGPREYLQPDALLMNFVVDLKAEGLPVDAPVSSRWLDLKLTAPDGMVMRADPQLSLPRPGESPAYRSEDGWLRPHAAVFLKKELHPHALARCTATGMLRLTLYKLKSQSVPLLDDRIHPTCMGLLRQKTGPPRRRRTGSGDSFRERLKFFDLVFLDAGMPPFPGIRAVHEDRKFSIPLTFPEDETETGFLIQHRRRGGSLWLEDSPKSQRWAKGAETLQAVASGEASPAGWRLVFDWHEPAGVVDIPITLHDVIPWTGRGGSGGVLRALSEVHPSENPSAEKVRSDLRYAYGLISNLIRGVTGSGSRQWHQALLLWKNILTEVGHDQLPVLFEFFPGKSNNPLLDQFLRITESPGGQQLPHLETPVGERIKALLQPADIPAILANPVLAAKLLSLLPDSALPPASLSAPGNPPPGSGGAEPAPAPAPAPAPTRAPDH